MLNEPLVSVISPCYNGEKYLVDFFNSLLSQDYTNVEFIFVNDGSTDNSEKIFFDFKVKLENKGWKIIYLKQQNGGAASAINTGLKKFTGKYLTWPDSDDILFPNYLSRKVEYMEEHSECGLLFSTTQILDLNNPTSSPKYMKCNKELLNESNLFESLMLEKNATCITLGAFIRSENFLQINPNREIYHNGHGQNFQMILPMAYNFKAEFIDDVLAYYVFHKDSNSNDKNTIYIRYLAYEDILFNVLNSIKMPIVKRIIFKIKVKICFGKRRLRYKIKKLIISLFGKKFLEFIKK